MYYQAKETVIISRLKGEITMIQILAGEKGEGKTKRMLEMANQAGKDAKGHVVFIDDDNRHMYDLDYSIRFVDTADFVMHDQKVFFGFICGILSQDGDIEKIFIDGINNIVKGMQDEDLTAFIKETEKLSERNNVDFIIIVSTKTDALPEEIKKHVI